MATTTRRLPAAVTPRVLNTPGEVEDMRLAIDARERRLADVQAEATRNARAARYWKSIVRHIADLDPMLMGVDQNAVDMARLCLVDAYGEDRLSDMVAFQAVIFRGEIDGMRAEVGAAANIAERSGDDNDRWMQRIRTHCPVYALLVDRQEPLTVQSVTAELGLCSDYQGHVSSLLQRLRLAGLVWPGPRQGGVPSYSAIPSPDADAGSWLEGVPGASLVGG